MGEADAPQLNRPPGDRPQRAFLLAAAFVVAIGTLLGALAIANPRSARTPAPSPTAAGEAVTPPPSSSAAARLPACPADSEAAGVDPSEAGLRHARTLELDNVGRPAGMAFSAPAGSLFLPVAAGRPEAPLDVAVLSVVGQRTGFERLEARDIDPRAIAADAVGQRIVALADGGRTIVEIPATADGLPKPGTRGVLTNDATPLGIGDPAGAAIDPSGTNLTILDASSDRLVRVGIAPDRAIDLSSSLRAGRVCVVSLEHPSRGGYLGLAVEPRRGHLLTLRPGEGRLDELLPGGHVVAVRSLLAFGLGDPVAIALGPTGDPTDAPDRSSVYVIDTFTPVGALEPAVRLHELALSGLQRAPVAVSNAFHADLVAVHPTSKWRVHSPDPSGLAYSAALDGLVLTDAEVDEMAMFEDANLFVARRDGQLHDTAMTGFSREPSDVAIDEAGGRWFVTDDLERRLYVVDLGLDRAFGTRDDIIRAIDTTRFGSFDPEGVAFGGGHVYIADGLGAEVYRLSAGPDGRFDGVAPDGDDAADHFDTFSLGQINPEGITYRSSTGTLWVVSNDRATDLLEVREDGELVRVIDLSFLAARAPAGLAEAPSSDDPDRTSLYLVDRGVDNSTDPNEDDGRLFEVRLEAGPPPNLLANSGFENGVDSSGGPRAWSSPDAASPVRSHVHSGESALELRATGETYSVTQSIRLVPGGHTYAVSGWLAEPGRAGSLRLAVRIRWFDAGGVQVGASKIADYQSAPPGWDRFAAAVSSPPGAVSARIVLAVTGSGDAWIVDDLLVQP